MMKFTESVVGDAALVWLNPDLPVEVFNDPYQVTLAAIRDTLLPKLLSGEIRVKDTERLVEEAI
jgi:hypothetical protein